MNWNKVRGDWTQFQGKVKSNWATLIDDDVMEIRGKKDELPASLMSTVKS
jgi:uncharacterized protein YjbJ (UPF0337 family)